MARPSRGRLMLITPPNAPRSSTSRLLLRAVASFSPAPVVASGGIARLEDIAALAALVPQGVDSVIIGKALYNGDFTLQQALAVADGARVEDVRP